MNGVTYQRLPPAALGNSRSIHQPPFILGHLHCVYTQHQEETETGSPSSPVFSQKHYFLNSNGQSPLEAVRFNGLWWVDLGWLPDPHPAVLSFPSLRVYREKVRWKSSWSEEQPRTSLTITRLDLKIHFIYCLLKCSWMVRSKEQQHLPSLPTPSSQAWLHSRLLCLLPAQVIRGDMRNWGWGASVFSKLRIICISSHRNPAMLFMIVFFYLTASGMFYYFHANRCKKNT